MAKSMGREGTWSMQREPSSTKTWEARQQAGQGTVMAQDYDCWGAWVGERSRRQGEKRARAVPQVLALGS